MLTVAVAFLNSTTKHKRTKYRAGFENRALRGYEIKP
jgi:hypothetical protein